MKICNDDISFTVNGLLLVLPMILSKDLKLIPYNSAVYNSIYINITYLKNIAIFTFPFQHWWMNSVANVIIKEKKKGKKKRTNDHISFTADGL